MDKLSESSCTRREALAMLGFMAASTQISFAAEQTQEKVKPQIALQLYTMRDPAKKDLADTLKRVRDMGWEYVQWSGMPNLTAEQIREALDKVGLKAMAAHVGIESFETDFEGQVKFWKTVGAEYVGPGGMMGDCKENLEAWLRGAKRLDVLGEKLRKVGMRLTYHNHASEFEKFEGDPRCKEDILIEATHPEHLFAELDIAWVYVGHADPAAYIRKFKGRCPTIHAKDLTTEPDGRKKSFVPLGKGVLNWEDIFAAGREAGIQWYIYEQDECAEGPFVAAQISLEFLKKNLG